MIRLERAETGQQTLFWISRIQGNQVKPCANGGQRRLGGVKLLLPQ
jgi:hypothetical protein